MSNRAVFTALLALPILAFFQNCSDVSFGSINGARLVAKSDTTVDAGIDSNTNTEIVVTPPAETEVAAPVEEVPVYADEGDLNYICVLEGPGKSISLHIERELLADNSTINIVCTSQSACLNIVSQAFSVKSVERRGFCGKNKHAVTLTGAQIAGLLQ